MIMIPIAASKPIGKKKLMAKIRATKIAGTKSNLTTEYYQAAFYLTASAIEMLPKVIPIANQANGELKSAK